MPNEQSPSPKIEGLDEYLARLRNEAGDHYIKKHGGKPASTCHTCLEFSAIIRQVQDRVNQQNEN